MKQEYNICTRCIMDTTDPDITFDDQGICNNCKEYEKKVKKNLLNAEEKKKRLAKIVQQIKTKGKNKKYDCVLGISGGVDSTYTAYIAKQLGLRPLAIHLDNGWDSELSVSNIEKTLKKLNIDLYTYVINWEEFKDLQLSYFKASVVDIEVASDHAIIAIIYRTKKIFTRYSKQTSEEILS